MGMMTSSSDHHIDSAATTIQAIAYAALLRSF